MLDVFECTICRRSNVSRVKVLSLTLRRLAAPCLSANSNGMSGCSAAIQSDVFNESVERLSRQCGLCGATSRQDLAASRAGLSVSCIACRGVAHKIIVGFIDNTGIIIARPSDSFQRCMYNSRKRDHVMKFQSDVTPNGLIFHLYGGAPPWNDDG